MIDNDGHAQFLHAMQEWTWMHLPARQLSPNDIYYIIQWANAGIPAAAFIQSFESYIHLHPHFFEKTFRISRLAPEAERVIRNHIKEKMDKKCIKEHTLITSDIYNEMINRITVCGQRTDNPILKTLLRTFYTNVKKAQNHARSNARDWDRNAEEWYKFKAEALRTWDREIDSLLSQCLSLLADDEQAALLKLSPREQIHCLRLGSEAEALYRARLLHEKIASYFDVDELLKGF